MSDSLHTHKPGDGHDHSHTLQPVHKHAYAGDSCCGSKTVTPAPVHSSEDSCCSSKVAAPSLVQLSEAKSADARLSSFRIEAMDCPTEQTLIQNKLGKLAGIQQLEFNLINRVLGVTHNLPDTAPIIDAIKSLGMQAEPLEAGVESTVAAPVKKHWWPLALSGVGALAAEVIHFTSAAPTWVVAIIALTSILSGGLTTYKKGWIALKNRNLNINALMSIAVTGAVLIGQWPEAAMVMFLFTVAELIEARSLDRARNAISGLMQMTPEQATVLQADGNWVELDVKSIDLGARVRVKPGERIALDGEVVSGSSTIDQAPITGESLPVEKTVGDKVFAGTINQAGSLEYAVTAAANNSTLARIIHAVEQAQGARAPTQRFVDQFSKIYTPVVFVLALAVAIIPPLFMAAAWFDWIYRALVLLVVACPCALVISTPVTIVSGLAAAARKGILVKGGVYLEGGFKLDYLALDKTGTITHGKPVQTDYLSLDPTADATAPAIAAALAGRSDHPVSLAIANAAVDKGFAALLVDNFEALAGRGVKGEVNGQVYHLGNHRLVEELGLCSPQLEEKLFALEKQGKSVVLLLDSSGPLALFAVADTVKETSREAIRQLHDLGVKTLMLTGDNVHTAQAIAAQVGIDQAKGDLLPTDKLQAIEDLYAKGRRVGMVGDGINDAPALARAEIGFAMAAAGTDTAIETADVALMDDDLRKIPAFISLSRHTAAILKQNIALALVIKAIFLGVTFAGLATMWMAVFADMGVSLLVVFNGLRLLRK
ncbi:MULTISPECIES: heavy metal translocating P-type ATPase [Pseudomonas]|uniref:P-type Zn(2+) transporter n=1 Tax=Pseudomonas fluorescens (strain Pf0-1) TaxID=205922 RepID=Q3K546_PSEPF|nr:MULTISPECIES: heavy metal translocating P-type ATPase [Pseudomonas]ABA77108.1 putative heavy metal ABC transport system, membrane protein [Pseudomonas fluorescens Pf0-1]MBL0799067.1 heavy metal translocating P-type ATPase [Pseudomonas sp. B7]MBY9022298.1 heavy metal translocating P-type ATPase [Pseudomonas fluorescens]MBY9028291.1 heavy metal translocating P-type ATPase [Pseudomonas fluorescens]MBY9034151.1 heavy metal translocating P-type ATPase [Pseudomonas fluorescens]